MEHRVAVLAGALLPRGAGRKSPVRKRRKAQTGTTRTQKLEPGSMAKVVKAWA